MHTTLTSKGQITLPLAARNQLGLHAGDKLLVSVVDDDAIMLTRAPSVPVSALRGLLPRPARALTDQEIDAGVAQHLARKHRSGTPSK